MTNAELKKRMNKKLYNASEVVEILKQLGVIQDKTSVVRCKDCKHYEKAECEDGTVYNYCSLYSSWRTWDNNSPEHDDFFCANGERKEPS